MNKKGTQVNLEGFSLTSGEKASLFSIARESIKSVLDKRKMLLPEENEFSSKLLKHLGAFVSLKINGKLRGCVGRFTSSEPLYKVIKMSAISSAFEDPRFPSLTKEEYKKTDIEITVLGPLISIRNISEIILGKHGIHIKKDSKSGTMLPQVATENGWTVEQFLGYTARDKAGIGWFGWKDADVSVFDGIVFEEADIFP